MKRLKVNASLLKVVISDDLNNSNVVIDIFEFCQLMVTVRNVKKSIDNIRVRELYNYKQLKFHK